MCQEGGSQESGEDCSEKDYCESKYIFVSSSEVESREGWESELEAIDDDSLYIPTPDRPVEVNYIDLPNKLCFLALPQVGKFLDMINQVRGCKTPGCNGNLAPTGVMSKGFGGCVYVSCRCDGCGSGGETYVNQPGRTKDIVSKCVQVAFIVAGGTHMGYYKTLKHALGIDVVGPYAFMDTIHYNYVSHSQVDAGRNL